MAMFTKDHDRNIKVNLLKPAMPRLLFNAYFKLLLYTRVSKFTFYLPFFSKNIHEIIISPYVSLFHRILLFLDESLFEYWAKSINCGRLFTQSSVTLCSIGHQDQILRNCMKYVTLKILYYRFHLGLHSKLLNIL
jgi:hypothetical protein